MTQQFFGLDFRPAIVSRPAPSATVQPPASALRLLPAVQPAPTAAPIIPMHADLMPVRGDEYRGALAVGQWVECMLYGGHAGYIVAIHGEQRPETIRQLLRGAIVTGGRADLEIHFDDGHDSHVPECIVRGVQWHIGGMLTAAEREEIDADGRQALAEKAAEAARQAIGRSPSPNRASWCGSGNTSWRAGRLRRGFITPSTTAATIASA